jgi:hypothetical protein
MRLEIANDRVDTAENLLDERHILAQLDLNEVSSALLRNFDERIARHVLNSLVSLVHELKELVDHCFEELPMCTQESRVLAYNVHNIRGYNRLIVLAAFLLD